MNFQVELDNGKYTYIFDNGRQKVLRYGEPWREQDLVGDNLVYMLACKADELTDRLAEVERDRDEALALSEAVRLEAQVHAQEARTQHATVCEIYQLISGGHGERGDWNGAEPVREYLAESARREKELAAMVGRLREIAKESQGWNWIGAWEEAEDAGEVNLLIPEMQSLVDDLDSIDMPAALREVQARAVEEQVRIEREYFDAYAPCLARMEKRAQQLRNGGGLSDG